MDRLARMLSRERHLLEVLLFKLVETRYLLAAGEARFLPWATTEVERAVARVREAELQRAVIVSELARELNVTEEHLTLTALADETEEPWQSIFVDHRSALLEIVNEIEEVAHENRRLANGGIKGIEDVLDMLAGRGKDDDSQVRLYGPSARPQTPAPLRFDQAL